MNKFTIDTARTSDRAELLDFLLQAFKTDSPDHLPFETLYPDLFLPTDEAMGCHLVIREDSRITACVGTYPLDLQLGPVRLRVAGVGQVACSPSLRRGGLVSTLLNHAARHMADNLKCPLSWLGGRREFYAKFGWERAGSIMVINIDSRSLAAEPTGWAVRQAEPTEETVDLLWDLRERQPVRQILSRQEWLAKLQRHGTEIWYATPDGAVQPSAFAVFKVPSRQLCEYTGIDTGIQSILATLVKLHKGVNLEAAPEIDTSTGFFWSQSVWSSAAMSNLMVTDLPALLSAYAPLMEKRLPPGKGIALTITAWQSRDSATVRLGTGGEELALDPLNMSRLLFGPFAPSALLQLPTHLRWLDQLFPLPFRLPLNSHL